MSRYNYCDTTDRIYFKKDAKTAKELIISEDACDRLNELERQLAEARKEIEERQETEDSLTNEINFLCDLIENIALSLEVNKKTKNDTKCVQQIIKLMKNFGEQLKEKGGE